MTTSTLPNRPTRGKRSPLADHGTTARAIGRPSQGIPGCKCQPCRDAKNRADTARELARLAGRPVRVPAAPAAAHIRMLLDAGMGWPGIRRASGCSGCTLAKILNGQPMTRRTVAERILAVRPEPAPGRYLPPVGTVRRIQALMAIGHPMAEISRATGIAEAVLADILHGRVPNVRGMTADRIAAAYDDLSVRPNTWGRPAAISRAKNRALREGWKDPAYWEDVDAIDDPDFDPDATTPRFITLGEDADELVMRGGLSWEEAAVRIAAATGRNLTSSYLQRSYYRWRDQAAAQDEPGQAVA